MSALLEVDGLKVHFRNGRTTVSAVDGVSLAVRAGETVGLVGESGCGKSSLGKALVGLVPVTSGSIRLEGREVTSLSRRELRPLRPLVQMIFQDPYSSLNPRLTVGTILEEPLIAHRRGTKPERAARVRQLMRRVGLHDDAAERYPHEFSGGQRQRIGIARALALDPRLIVCDEAVSALDVSIQAQVVNLLMDLQRERGLSYLFISHDLAVVRHIADRVMVMYLGHIVESAGRRSLWRQPLHPYTRALMAAVPRPHPPAVKSRFTPPLGGEIPSPTQPPSGCRFRTRCPFAAPICAGTTPGLKDLGEDHFVACHFVARREDGSVAFPV